MTEKPSQNVRMDPNFYIFCSSLLVCLKKGLFNAGIEPECQNTGESCPNRPRAAHGSSLERMVAKLQAFSSPVLLVTAKETPFKKHWPKGGPWETEK